MPRIYAIIAFAALLPVSANAADSVFKLVCQSLVNDEVILLEQVSAERMNGKTFVEKILSVSGVDDEPIRATACRDNIGAKNAATLTNIDLENYLFQKSRMCTVNDEIAGGEFGELVIGIDDKDGLRQWLRVDLNQSPVSAFTVSPKEATHKSLRRDYDCSNEPVFALPTILAD